MTQQRACIAIDLKSFYASVECVERGLDPLHTHLVVADRSRTEKTICLAVSPSLKAYGISGRARLFEVEQKLREVNTERRLKIAGRPFRGKSYLEPELANHPDLEVNFIAAPPRMAHYIDFSTRIYNIYLRYVSAEDIHVYSIDEVLMDVTDYLQTYKMTARQLAKQMMKNILTETGITATAGIGTNFYLCKVAMDILAKHEKPDNDGARMAELNELSFREQLWNHRPLTDFWRIGRGIAQRLAGLGILTMGELARFSLQKEDLLFRVFGINAELLIDHAWGWEPCTMQAIKAYRPEVRSLSSGQVLTEPYICEKAKVVVQEMADNLALELLEKRLVCDQLTLTIGYDTENLNKKEIHSNYSGDTVTDHYGRAVPKPSHGSINLTQPTSSLHLITEAVCQLFDRITNPLLLIRRLTLSAEHVIHEEDSKNSEKATQLDLFTDYETLRKQQKQAKASLDKERRLQEARLAIRQRFGKNAILRGLNFEEGATAKERNQQIGGHKA